MSYFTINLFSIEKCNNILYKRIQNFDEKSFEDGVTLVESLDTKEINKALMVSIGQEQFRLNSAYRPSVEATKWAEQFEFSNIGTIVSMFGLGNGVFPREILKKLDKDELLFIYEPSPHIFLHVIDNYDLTDLIEDKRVFIAVEEINGDEYKYSLRDVINWMNMSSQEVIKHPQYVKMFGERHEKFRSVIKDVNEISIINRNTEEAFGKKVIDNIFHNVKYAKDANIITDFKNDFSEDTPVIIVSAGPSLDKNIEELKAAKGKSIIMGTDTSLKFLFQHDIIPDFIVTLDPKKSLRHFRDEKFKNIPMFCLFESNQSILNLHDNRKIFFNVPDYISRFYEKLGKSVSNLNSGGSVATAAFSISVSLGFNKIILIGQDLAYSGSYTHAGGTGESEQRIISNTRYVEDIFGNKIMTRPDWYIYLNWFVQAVALVKDNGGEVIDATEGGAKIEGTSIMPLKEAIQKYCINSVNVSEVVQNKLPCLDNNEWLKFIEYISKSKMELIEIKRKSTEAYKICEKLIVEAKKENMDSPKSQSWVKKISKYNRYMEDLSVYIMVEAAMTEISINTLSNINILSDNEIENQVNTYRRAIDFYKGMISACVELEPKLEKSIQILKSL